MRAKSEREGKAISQPIASLNISELMKKFESSCTRQARYKCFVEQLNQYLKARFHCKTEPIEASVDYTTIDASRAAFKLYLRLSPPHANYTKQSLVIAHATFRQKNIYGTNVFSETRSFFEFLVQQSVLFEFNDIYLDRWCGIPDLIIEMYDFNRLDDELGWQITCEELKLKM